MMWMWPGLAFVPLMMTGGCAVAEFRGSDTNSETISDPSFAGKVCPQAVTKANWLGGPQVPHEFAVSQSGAEITARRSDSGSGWAMTLDFFCCPCNDLGVVTTRTSKWCGAPRGMITDRAECACAATRSGLAWEGGGNPQYKPGCIITQQGTRVPAPRRCFLRPPTASGQAPTRACLALFARGWVQVFRLLLQPTTSPRTSRHLATCARPPAC